MKILKRNYEHRNVAFFLIFSMIYLQVLSALSTGSSIFEMEQLKIFFNSHYIILSIALITFYMIVRMKRHSEKMLFFCLLLISAKSFIMLSQSFNKLILTLNFFYLIFSFYFFITWEIETLKASYRPLFSANDLEKDSRFFLKGRVRLSTKDEDFVVSVTNLDPNSCFVLFDTPLAKEFISDIKKMKTCRLSVEHEGVLFSDLAIPVSLYDRGIGFSFTGIGSDRGVNLSDLYDVSLEKGFFS